LKLPPLTEGDFPASFLFCPETVFLLTQQQLTISTLAPSAEEIWNRIQSMDTTPLQQPLPEIQFHARMEPAIYLKKVEQLLQHIQRGDCFEINFCQEFFASPVSIPALTTYIHLMALSPNPFSCFYKNEGRYVLCASPERFLQKKGARLCSQPIKGTIRRSPLHPAEDEALKENLRSSTKNQSENIMVVDLVRNDLSRICKEGSVRVSELLGLYTFPQVHQLISTVEGELLSGTTLFEILQATFPMGSMTGAPKKRVLELIEEYEPVPRGIYSGSIGYITPEKDFDWNVVIRSLVYLSEKKYLSYQVGGGITANSDPQQEWEECLVKAKAMRSLWE
jgi:para-aminobenzoate synthetase component 1